MSVFSFLIVFLSLSVPATALWPLHAQQPLAFEKTSSTGINENPEDSNSNHATATTLASASCSSLTPSYPTSFWYEEIEHNGLSSFLDESYGTYTVFRNVVADFGADNTGKSDASKVIRNAILAGASKGPLRNDSNASIYGTTRKPAIVYLPSGTYQMTGSIQLFVGTVLVGNPLNPPVLKATANFPNDHIVYGKDPNLPDGTTAFYTGFKNIVIDSTNIDKDNSITLLDWTVSQATQLTNVLFNMPTFSTGHIGVSTYGGKLYNSNTIFNDLKFVGGAFGIYINDFQQAEFKNMTFSGCNVGFHAGGTNVVITSSSFSNGSTGIDANGVSGSLTVIDTTFDSIGTCITSYNSNGVQNSMILENVINVNSGNTVELSNTPLVTGNISDTWIHGNYYAPGDGTAQYENALTMSTPRSPSLLEHGFYFTMPPPTFSSYSVSRVVNIKSVPKFPVHGDGKTDDTANINAILSAYAGCAVIYFPAGTYIVSNTIFVPAGSRIYGDAYASAISANGSVFYNPDSPVPMVQVGNASDVGVAQINDMLFTTADVLQGCKLLEVNIAGSSQGDVGIWNSHFRVGGAAGSLVEVNCGSTPDQCKAAWGLLHLTSSSSAYVENMWGWVADHDLDGYNAQIISVGRGALIEATAGTWLVGTAMEHNTLYQYNFNNAANVYTAMQQSETAYWQGANTASAWAPSPWTNNLVASDPDFNECGPSDAQCRMAFFERIRDAQNLFLYGGCDWAYFNGYGNECDNLGSSTYCQQNAVRVLGNTTATYLYGTNVHGIENLMLNGNGPVASSPSNYGGWTPGGVVAAYLYNS